MEARHGRFSCVVRSARYVESLQSRANPVPIWCPDEESASHIQDMRDRGILILASAREMYQTVYSAFENNGNPPTQPSSVEMRAIANPAKADPRQRPPETSMNVPVTYDASSDSNHMTALATSDGCPPRPIGIEACNRATRSGSPPLACISV